MILKTYIIAPGDGLEMRNIARSLVEGHGYSSPFGVPSGPTAWAAPLFPGIIAVCFKLFGAFTVPSAIAIRVLNCVLSAASCVMIYVAAKPAFGEQVARLSSLIFVFYPNSIWAAIRTTWDTTLLSLLLLVVTYLLTRLASKPELGFALVTGAAIGVTLLDNVAPLFTLPLLLLWYFWQTRSKPDRFKLLAVLAAAPALIFGPWMVRNYSATGSFVTRCCAGVELYAGNNQDSWERRFVNGNFKVDPVGSAAELKLYVDLGEKAYDSVARQRALSFIRNNPRKALDLFLWKIGGWWLDIYTDEGVYEDKWIARALQGKQPIHWIVLPFFLAGAFWSIKNRNRLSYPYLILTFVYPLPYYIFSVGEHMHFPIESFMVTLACYGALASLGFTKKAEALPPS